MNFDVEISRVDGSNSFVGLMLLGCTCFLWETQKKCLGIIIEILLILTFKKIRTNFSLFLMLLSVHILLDYMIL